MRKIERDLRKLARQYDRRVVHTKKHYKLECTNGDYRSVFFSATTSDQRAIRNLEAELKRVHEGRDPYGNPHET